MDSPGEIASYEFEQDRVVLGRGVGADVRLPHPTVSVRHASIRLDGARWVLVDHGSTNGTKLGDQGLVAERPKVLRDGDVVAIGTFRATFSAGAVRAPTSRERTSSLAKRLARLGSAPATPPRLVVMNGDRKGATLDLPEAPARLVLGRGEGLDLSLPDADASREHCEVIVDLEGPLVRDLGSKNGLVVNDKPVRQKRLRDRDELMIGATIVTYEDPADAYLAGLDGQPDEALPPPPPPPVATAPVVEEPDTEPAREPERPIAPPPPPPATLSRVEVLVAWLAAAVLLASLGGLYWLLR